MSASSAAGHRQAVDFELAAVMVEQRELRGDHNLLASQVNQSIQNLTGTQQALQGDVRAIATQQGEANAMLHQLTERSTGFDRLFTRLQEGSGGTAKDVKGLELSVAEWRGAIKALALCGFLALSAVTAFVVYRFEAVEKWQDAHDRNEHGTRR